VIGVRGSLSEKEGTNWMGAKNEANGVGNWAVEAHKGFRLEGTKRENERSLKKHSLNSNPGKRNKGFPWTNNKKTRGVRSGQWGKKLGTEGDGILIGVKVKRGQVLWGTSEMCFLSPMGKNKKGSSRQAGPGVGLLEGERVVPEGGGPIFNRKKGGIDYLYHTKSTPDTTFDGRKKKVARKASGVISRNSRIYKGGC